MIGLRFVAHLWNYVMLRQGALQLLSADVVCPMQNCSRQAAGSMHAWYEGPAGTDCMLLDGSVKGSLDGRVTGCAGLLVDTMRAAVRGRDLILEMPATHVACTWNGSQAALRTEIDCAWKVFCGSPRPLSALRGHIRYPCTLSSPLGERQGRPDRRVRCEAASGTPAHFHPHA